MSDPLMSLVVMECESALARFTEKPDVKTALKAAMKAASEHFMVTDKNVQFQAAVFATMLYFKEGSPEYGRLYHEMQQIKKVNAILVAAQAGLSIGLEGLADEDEEPKPEPVGVLKLWREIAGSRP